MGRGNVLAGGSCLGHFLSGREPVNGECCLVSLTQGSHWWLWLWGASGPPALPWPLPSPAVTVPSKTQAWKSFLERLGAGPGAGVPEEGRSSLQVHPPCPGPHAHVCGAALCTPSEVPELGARSVAGIRSRLPRPGAPSQPPARASTERLLFRGSCRKLESRTSSPTHAWNFPCSMGWRGASSCPWGEGMAGGL